MIAFANAKINLGLYVTAKREDGYHAIESIFLPISLHDVIEVANSSEQNVVFKSEGIAIDGLPEDNLCYKAYHLLKKDYQIGGIDCYLLKNLPIGAGLGGGSSDAAFMLKLLNDLFSLNLSSQALEKYAAQLGSDCPFYINNKTSFVSGRGEIMEPVELNLADKHIIVVYPDIHISTKQAYSQIKPHSAPVDLKEISNLHIKDWRENISNDFEKSILPLYPQIGLIKEKLYDHGAIYASMSGSGSAVYGIFDEKVNLQKQFPDFYCRACQII